MRTFIPVKFISYLLLLVMMLVTAHGMHECAEAASCSVTATGASADSHTIVAASPQSCPSPTPAEHQDDDGCDSCFNCPCHAPMAVDNRLPGYDPLILMLPCSDPFQYLPEVFLSKFIPPQNLV